MYRSIGYTLSFMLLLIAFFASNRTVYADCQQISPLDVSNLFQIKRTPTSAQLFFSPLSPGDQLSGYTIAYGLQPNNDLDAIFFPYGDSTGVITYTINSLSPAASYVFRVRGTNGCANGPWSNYLSDKFHPVSSSNGSMLVAGSSDMTVLTIGGFGGLVIVGGLLLFFYPKRFLSA